jgi:hypothetical protein
LESERIEHLLERAHRLESIGELAGGIAHDFNNVLGVIACHAELVDRAIGPRTVSSKAPNSDYWEEVMTDVDQIRRAVKRGAELAHRLLAFAGQESSQPRTIDITSVIDEVMGLLGRSMGERVELRANIEPGTWLIHFDPVLLEQVLINLAVNARYAMKGGGTLTIDAQNVAGSVLGDFYVRLRVTDTGEGMTEATLSRVFEPYFTTKPPGEGTGLGLASAHTIIAAGGGRIEIQSEPGRGTSVIIALPRSTGESPVCDGAEVSEPPLCVSGRPFEMVQERGGPLFSCPRP